MLTGFNLLQENSFISENRIVQIHHIIVPKEGGIRTLSGTVIMNTKTGRVLQTPPQNKDEIEKYLSNLEKYINMPELESIDPILKMAVIHFQFESIHPFCDGNGRTGRILNILYLVLAKEIDFPILYLSKFINQNREVYYECLNDAQNDISKLKDYLTFMIEGVERISEFTLRFINSFIATMNQAARTINEKCQKLFSEELLEHIFYDFYTKNDFLCEKQNISRNTASKYLYELADAEVLIEETVEKTNFIKTRFYIIW